MSMLGGNENWKVGDRVAYLRPSRAQSREEIASNVKFGTLDSRCDDRSGSSDRWRVKFDDEETLDKISPTSLVDPSGCETGMDVLRKMFPMWDWAPRDGGAGTGGGAAAALFSDFC